MLFLKPKQLGRVSMDPAVLKEDLKKSRRFGPCAVGEKALYLNSFYFEKRYYLPVSSVRRIYKRIAMSKGGFTGKGLFASIPYLVVEYDDGEEKQCNFKFEERVDELIACFHERWPDVPVHSKEAQKRLDEKARVLKQKEKKLNAVRATESFRDLEEGIRFLEEKPLLYETLSRTAKNKRINDRSNPAYKWVALAVTVMGAVSAGYGIWSLLTHRGFAMIFLLFGLAALFVFSGANVLPTRGNNRAAVQKQLTDAIESMQAYVDHFREMKGKTFPVPARYAHPGVLRRMQEVIADRRAKDPDEAFEAVKKDLKALDHTVQVEQEEYDEIMQIKPLFLVHDYQ